MSFHAPLIIDIAGITLTEVDRRRLAHRQRCEAVDVAHLGRVRALH